MYMQCTRIDVIAMSFDFSNNGINQFKAQSAYKDASGMGGGGMYFQQKKKQDEQPEEDMFEYNDNNQNEEIVFDSELKEENIPKDTLFNKFVNWFRQGY